MKNMTRKNKSETTIFLLSPSIFRLDLIKGLMCDRCELNLIQYSDWECVRQSDVCVCVCVLCVRERV